MAKKPDYVDLISEATRQHWRRSAQRDAEPAPVKEERRLSHWPPARFEKWRLEHLTPWKLTLKPWKFKDWV